MFEQSKKISFLDGRTIYLTPFRKEFINDRYLLWINDRELTQFLDTGHFPVTVGALESYINSFDYEKKFILAIIYKENDEHIGNVSLIDIDWINRVAEISILIGEREYWGKGIMFETFSLIIKHAFNILNLNKIIAGAPIVNVQSIITLKKLGFSKEATFREQFFFDGKYIDSLVFGLLKSDFMTTKI